jgi:CHAD domain-containing protein
MPVSKQFEIRKRETFEQGTHRILEELNTETARLMTTGSRVHLSIHEARKNIKKLRAVLRLIRHEIGVEKYRQLNTFYSETGQKVALLRDDTSMVELLENFKVNIKSPELQKVIQKSIRLAKKKREKEFADFFKNKKGNQLNKTISGKTGALRQANIQGNPEVFILQSVGKVHSDTIKRMKQAEKEGTNEAYHNWRKQVKYLMFQMMILRNAWPLFFEAYIAELDKLQKLLGNLHDLNILNNYVVQGDLLTLDKKQKEALLSYIYPHRANLKKQTHTIGKLLFAESSPAFSKRLLGIWMNSGFGK